MNFTGTAKKTVCALAAAAVMAAASGCTNYTKMMREQPADYISMAEENTMDAILNDRSSEERKILEDALKDGSFTLGFEAEGIAFSGEAHVNEKDGKTAQTYTLTGSKGTSAQAYLFADKDVLKIGTNGLSGSHIYDIVLDTAEEKLPASIFAPDSGTAYALEQSEYDMLLEYAKAFADGADGKNDPNNKYMDIVNGYTETHPPVTEEKVDSDIGGTMVQANVITYDIPKEDITALMEQFVDVYAEDADLSEYGYDSKEEMKEELTSELNELEEFSVHAAYYIDSKTHMLMKMEFSVKISVPDEYTGESKNGNIYGSCLYGADPENSDTINTVFGIEDGSEKYEFYIDTTVSENGSASNIAMYDGETRSDLAVLTTNRDGENYTITLDIPEVKISCKVEGTIKTDKKSFELTVDRLSAGTGSGEVAYSPKGVFKVEKGGEINELEAEKELLDITEEEMDTLANNIESDFSAVFDEVAEDSAAGNYMKKSKQSAANANARTCHTAASAVLVEECIEGTVFSGSELTGTGAAFDFGGTAIDVSDYLGTDFTGYVYGEFDPEHYEVDYVLWSEEPIPEEYKHSLTSEEQEELADEGVYIGCYTLNN